MLQGRVVFQREKFGTLGRVPEIYTNIYHISGLYSGCIGPYRAIWRLYMVSRFESPKISLVPKNGGILTFFLRCMDTAYARVANW